MNKAFYTLANCDQIKCDGGLIKYWLEFPEWCSSETIDGPIKRKHQLIQVRFPYCNLKSSKTTNGNFPPTSPNSPTATVQYALKTSHARRAYQKVQRRKETLFKKAFEYSAQCDADIQLVVRIRKTGQVFTLISNTKGWPLSAEELVC